MDLRTVKAAASPALAENDKLRSDILKTIVANKIWQSKFASIEVILGDARRTVAELKNPANIVFLDPFSHDVNPELWSYDFMKTISAKLANHAVIATYSNAFPVRGAMLRCNLLVGETPAFGRKKGGTIASFDPAKIAQPLPEKELNIILKSTAGTAYRDTDLRTSREKICELRKKTVQKLQKLNIPKWFRGPTKVDR